MIDFGGFMEIKTKYIDRRHWKRVLKRESSFCDIEEKKGVAYLIKIKQVSEPMTRMRFGERVVLADKDYYWLEIALENENYWLTAMFNPKGEFVQYYFDISRKNVIDGENSYFEDLFLDIVVQNNKTVSVLDEDELYTAYEENIISKEEFDFANLTCEKLVKNILNNCASYDEMCVKYFEILREKIENKK